MPDAAQPPYTLTQLRSFREEAGAAARLGGAELRRMFGAGIEARVKSGARDLLTEADLASERQILRFIAERHPDHGWQSEEAGNRVGASPLRWVIDPLDGTANFAHGYPHFSVSVAVMHGGCLIAGAVYDPMRDECFDAALGGGGALNGLPLQVSTVTDLSHALVSTGFPYAPEQRRRVADLTARAIERVQMLRRSGSAALDCAYVSAGRAECHWELILKLHDVAAGLLLVQEAGGVAEELQAPGWPVGYIVSGARPVHDGIVAMIRECFGPVETRPLCRFRDEGACTSVGGNP